MPGLWCGRWKQAHTPPNPHPPLRPAPVAFPPFPPKTLQASRRSCCTCRRGSSWSCGCAHVRPRPWGRRLGLPCGNGPACRSSCRTSPLPRTYTWPGSWPCRAARCSWHGRATAAYTASSATRTSASRCAGGWGSCVRLHARAHTCARGRPTVCALGQCAVVRVLAPVWGQCNGMEARGAAEAMAPATSGASHRPRVCC